MPCQIHEIGIVTMHEQPVVKDVVQLGQTQLPPGGLIAFVHVLEDALQLIHFRIAPGGQTVGHACGFQYPPDTVAVPDLLRRHQADPFALLRFRGH